MTSRAMYVFSMCPCLVVRPCRLRPRPKHSLRKFFLTVRWSSAELVSLGNLHLRSHSSALLYYREVYMTVESRMQVLSSAQMDLAAWFDGNNMLAECRQFVSMPRMSSEVDCSVSRQEDCYCSIRQARRCGSSGFRDDYGLRSSRRYKEVDDAHCKQRNYPGMLAASGSHGHHHDEPVAANSITAFTILRRHFSFVTDLIVR